MLTVRRWMAVLGGCQAHDIDDAAFDGLDLGRGEPKIRIPNLARSPH